MSELRPQPHPRLSADPTIPPTGPAHAIRLASGWRCEIDGSEITASAGRLPLIIEPPAAESVVDVKLTRHFGRPTGLGRERVRLRLVSHTEPALVMLNGAELMLAKDELDDGYQLDVTDRLKPRNVIELEFSRVPPTRDALSALRMAWLEIAPP